jgi:hypothetical protein
MYKQDRKGDSNHEKYHNKSITSQFYASQRSDHTYTYGSLEDSVDEFRHKTTVLVNESHQQIIMD